MAMAMRWLGRPNARTAAFRSCSGVRPSTGRPWTGRRNKHTAPTLDNHIELQQKGVPKLFSPKAFNLAYTEYEQLMVDELNECTAGLGYETHDIRSLVVEFARNPAKAYAFNVASMAFNNHFFFRGLIGNRDVESVPSPDVQALINRHFSSMDTLRETFLATAEAMFGPGFVWLVQTDESTFGSLRILTTYLAGSPLSAAHYRRQSHDLNKHSPDSYQELNKVGAFGSSARVNHGPKKPLGGVDVVPLLCVNTWEHVWLPDYGIRGKREFLDAWWNRIDWELVRQNVKTTGMKPRGESAFLSS